MAGEGQCSAGFVPTQPREPHQGEPGKGSRMCVVSALNTKWIKKKFLPPKMLQKQHGLLLLPGDI